MNGVLRQEKKYLLSNIEHYRYYHEFNKIFIPDTHNNQSGYIVRSLYFDTLDNKDFFQKNMGIEIRRKVRLRIYDPHSKFAMLEIKQKQGENQLKRALKISRDDAIELTKGHYECLLKYKDPFAQECYSYMVSEGYVPVCIVQYYRQAFICKENNIRITFDRNIVATESNFNIFDEKLLMYPVFPKSNIVLEVKYNGFLLSYVKDLINQVDKISLSVSKYCLARQVSLGYNYI